MNTPQIVIYLVAVLWGSNHSPPTVDFQRQPTLAICEKLAASFDTAVADNNAADMPAFEQSGAATCITIVPHVGWTVKGPI